MNPPVITQDGKWFFAEDETLNALGIGLSREEAIEDMQDHIAQFSAYYGSLKDSDVIGDAVRLKRAYAARKVPA